MTKFCRNCAIESKYGVLECECKCHFGGECQ